MQRQLGCWLHNKQATHERIRYLARRLCQTPGFHWLSADHNNLPTCLSVYLTLTLLALLYLTLHYTTFATLLLSVDGTEIHIDQFIRTYKRACAKHRFPSRTCCKSLTCVCVDHFDTYFPPLAPLGTTAVVKLAVS